MAWWRFSRHIEEWREEAREHIGEGHLFKFVAIVLIGYALTILALGFYWSREQAQFTVQEAMRRELPKQAETPAAGSATTAVLIDVVATLLNKPGGLISNDVAPPGVWLDNMPSWEYGALTQARDRVRVLRETTTRTDSATTSTTVAAAEDESLARAEPRLNFAQDSWALPSSESQYREALDYLHEYLERLQVPGDKRAVFDAGAAPLGAWLQRVSLRLGNLSQRLSACVRPTENPLLPPSTEPGDIPLTPRNAIDNVFYEARGSTWALLHLLRAAEIDYAGALAQNNAQAFLQEAIRDLEQSQAPIYAPVILNGSGFGLLANHSLVMASYVARANAALINLRNALTQPQPPIAAPN